MTIYIVDLESVESRYTCEWKWHLPELIKGSVPIEGAEDIPKATTPGAFLNFGGTNIYKAKQIETMGRMFCDGTVKAGDHFLFTDAWHPGIISLKYMSELLQVPVTIHSMWHAGSYDPHDFLGRLIDDKQWTFDFERSIFHASDYNYFATKFHVSMFVEALFNITWSANGVPDYELTTKMQTLKRKIVRTGWPMEYLNDASKTTLFDNNVYRKKENLIVFPHRIAPEKQPDIFRDLAQSMPEYKFIMCQEKQLTKAEYHAIIRRAKLIFSANLQETLGISPYEGALVGAIPMVPDRLSYSEMYSWEFKYNTVWTIDWGNYQQNKPKLLNLIKYKMDNYKDLYDSVVDEAYKLSQNYFSCKPLLEKLNT
jgi:hypothetical protein